jgi:uncharacterized membrane protein YbhN (UPF0104 family)
VLKKPRFWIGVLISIAALILAFRSVNLRDMWAELSGANYWLLVVSVPVLFLFLILRAFRWRLLFYPQQGLRVRNLFAVINVGYLISNILPARLGDVARAYLIGDTEPVSRAAAFSTVVAERVLDALCAVAGFFLVLPFAPVPDWMVRSGLIVGAAALAAVAVFVVLVRRREWTLRVTDRILRALHWPSGETMSGFRGRLAARTRLRFLARMPWLDRPRLESMAGSLIDGLSGITTLRQGPRLVLFSVAIWVVISAYYWIVLLAFDPAQPPVAGLAVCSVTALGMTVPSSPGFIGVFEFLTRETLVLFGMGAQTALSYAFAAHLIVYVVYTILGAICMQQQNLTVSEVQRRISNPAEAETST